APAAVATCLAGQVPLVAGASIGSAGGASRDARGEDSVSGRDSVTGSDYATRRFRRRRQSRTVVAVIGTALV
ncbi:MAG: hypothetical protein AAGK78_05550, partial [Planctomycetota bacterium]